MNRFILVLLFMNTFTATAHAQLWGEQKAYQDRSNAEIEAFHQREDMERMRQENQRELNTQKREIEQQRYELERMRDNQDRNY